MCIVSKLLSFMPPPYGIGECVCGCWTCAAKFRAFPLSTLQCSVLQSYFQLSMYNNNNNHNCC